MFAVFKKEILTYFTSSVGYIFMAVFLLISGILFTTGNVFSMNSDYAGFMGSLIIIFLLVVPLLTMKIFSEEKKQKTDQLLLTSPRPVASVVLGKFLAAAALYLLTLIVTGIYPLLLSFHGRLDSAQILGTYIGFFLLGCSFISIGIYISSLTESQAGAAILTFCMLIITWVIDFLGAFMPVSILSGMIFAVLITLLTALWMYNATRNISATTLPVIAGVIIIAAIYLINRELYANLIGRTLSWFSLTKRFTNFPMGILKLDALVYYLSFSGFFLFLTTGRIEKQRWS